MVSTDLRSTQQRRTRLQVYEIVVDCADPRALGRFWAEVLSYDISEEDDDVSYIEDPSEAGPSMCFNKVGEPKLAKNRLHLDLNVAEHEMEEEVARLIDLGARQVNVGQNPDAFWTVLVDLEGNEFCLVC